MKALLIKNALVADPGSPYRGKRKDILIENGAIAAIDDQISADADVIEGEQLGISPGWVDMRANFWDPGFEYKEDIASGSEAAMYGGFTAVALLPETEPEISTKAETEYIRNKSSKQAVSVFPWASLKQRHRDLQLSEMRDLADSGAIGFSNGYSSLEDNGFLLKALLYLKPIGKPVMLYPESKSLAGKGQINEGLVSVNMGIQGAPALAEELEVANILSLAKYAGTPVHISCVTSARTIEQIRAAIKAGIQVTADITAHHLYFDERDVSNFNTHLKLRPPLRTEEDKLALRQAVLEEDFISVVTDHTPHEDDRKKCEFELAAFGATGLQTCFSELLSIYGPKKIMQIVQAISIRPAKVLGLEVSAVKEQARANFTIFDMGMKWRLNEATNKSKSRNNPLWNKELTGKAVAVINNGIIKNLKH